MRIAKCGTVTLCGKCGNSIASGFVFLADDSTEDIDISKIDELRLEAFERSEVLYTDECEICKADKLKKGELNG